MHIVTVFLCRFNITNNIIVLLGSFLCFFFWKGICSVMMVVSVV